MFFLLSLQMRRPNPESEQRVPDQYQPHEGSVHPQEHARQGTSHGGVVARNGRLTNRSS